MSPEFANRSSVPLQQPLCVTGCVTDADPQFQPCHCIARRQRPPDAAGLGLFVPAHREKNSLAAWIENPDLAEW
jgi:hypothetical protein